MTIQVENGFCQYSLLCHTANFVCWVQIAAVYGSSYLQFILITLVIPNVFTVQEVRSTSSPLQPLPVDCNSPGPSGYPSNGSPVPTDYGGSSPTYMSPESPREDMDQHWQQPPRGQRLLRPNSLDLPGSSRSTTASIHHEPTRNPHRNFPVGKTNKPRYELASLQWHAWHISAHLYSYALTNKGCHHFSVRFRG